MSFKYINPGYTFFFDNRTAINTNSSFSQFTNDSRSRTGVCFWNTENRYNYIDTDQRLDEFWIKAECWIPSRSNSTSIIIGERYDTYYNPYNGLFIEISSSGIMNASIYHSGSTTNFSISNLRLNGLNTIFLHMKYGDSGFIECFVNNESTKIQAKISRYETNTLVKIYGTCYWSGIIISDEEISPYERVVPLAVSNTITDMETLESGLYVADNASETLLQSVSTTSLANEYGSDAQVTGIALIGNPAYEVDDVIGSLTAITKHNGVVTDHDKITLLTDSDAMIVSSFSFTTDTTVADLANYQFGWRAED